MSSAPEARQSRRLFVAAGNAVCVGVWWGGGGKKKCGVKLCG